MDNTNTLQEGIHSLRKQIDGVIQKAAIYKNKPNQEVLEGQMQIQREISIVYTKLQEAKMWAGKCLEQIGSELPKEYQDKAE